jgi:hypothetical protein
MSCAARRISQDVFRVLPMRRCAHFYSKLIQPTKDVFWRLQRIGGKQERQQEPSFQLRSIFMWWKTALPSLSRVILRVYIPAVNSTLPILSFHRLNSTSLYRISQSQHPRSDLSTLNMSPNPVESEPYRPDRRHNPVVTSANACLLALALGHSRSPSRSKIPNATVLIFLGIEYP